MPPPIAPEQTVESIRRRIANERDITLVGDDAP
jgi:hypothetical protein